MVRSCAEVSRFLAEQAPSYDVGRFDGEAHHKVARCRSSGLVKVTSYFETMRKRPDRATILDAWIERAMTSPARETVQNDGRIRRWACIPEMDNRHLRVILLEDGETVHNVFFDRRFVP